MSRLHSPLWFPRLTALAAALSLAYTNDIIALDRQGMGHGGGYVREMSVPAEPARSKIHARPASVNTPANIFVSNCDDSGSGSLRDAASIAVSGDTIDLTGLTCAAISLTTGEIVLAVDDVTLIGPGQGDPVIGPAAGMTGRVLKHTGHGLLAISGLHLSGGYYGIAPATPYLKGGCLYSAGSVTFDNSKAVGCTVYDPSLNPVQTANGGAISAYGDLHLNNSTVSNNKVKSIGAVRGGGVYARGNLYIQGSFVYDNYIKSNTFVVGGGATARGDVVVQNSGFEYNYAGQLSVGAVDHSFGGGLFAERNATITSSLFYRNGAHNVGGISFTGGSDFTAAIVNSTISTNTATNLLGGVYSQTPLTVSNSTIAFNRSGYTGSVYVAGAGLGVYQTTVDLQSSIIAQNYTPGNGLDFSAYGSTITGSGNLIMRSIVSPPGTLTDDPLLTPLGNYGGATDVHALAAASPAIDRGNNNAGLAYDQRGAPFPRLYGAGVDIGAYELQSPPDLDRIFRNGFDGTLGR